MVTHWEPVTGFSKAYNVTVFDGDTVYAQIFENDDPTYDDQFASVVEEQPILSVRLCGIDTPELANPYTGSPAERYSRLAENALQTLVGDGNSLSIFVTRLKDKTQNRLEGVLFPDRVRERYEMHEQRLKSEKRWRTDHTELDQYFKESLNWEMCAQGWAEWEWDYAPAKWGFGDAELTAHQQKLGKWRNARLSATRQVFLKPRVSSV